MICVRCGKVRLTERPCEYCIANEQTRLLNEPCVRCGHEGELLIEQHDGMVCVNCITKDNGEDGDAPPDG